MADEPANDAPAALCVAIAAGDPAAFGAFYDAWFDATCALARAVSRRDESFCLDVVQDVMLKVVRSVPALTSEAAIAAWLSRAVWSTVRDHCRREARRQRRERGAVDRRGAGAPDAASALAEQERAAWLRAQLADLPPAERRLVEARFLSGDSVAAVGASLGLSTDAAHGRLRRALRRLRAAAALWGGT